MVGGFLDVAAGPDGSLWAISATYNGTTTSRLLYKYEFLTGAWT